MSTRPSGTVTFLFTDIEGSTASWERHPQAMQAALRRHEELLRVAIEERKGYVFKMLGDAFCAAFDTALDALAAAREAQAAVARESWDGVSPLRVRMAVHTGTAEERDGDYFGPVVHRVARMLATAHGGQTLVSEVTSELVRDALPEDLRLRDVGEHRLKDLTRPERIFQLVAPGLADEFPPLRSLESHPHNLPVQPTTLVGREAEIEAVRHLVLEDGVRLVTLTGPGGSGKTRLALQVAVELIDDLEDGVFFVGLATVTDPAFVAPTIAQTLGVSEAAEAGLPALLAEHLRGKRLLLVLDNFEQVLPAAPLVAELLASCPGLKVLVTSRASLHLRGEREFPVPPLALPDAKRLPPLATLSQYTAVTLFIQRALAVKPSFAVTNENAAAVAEICVRLDGLPLAIELAAARIKLLTPEAMLTRLESRLRLLTGGARDLPERQQTLRGAIAWSYELLDDGERRLFRRLSVFAGGCTLEAAEAVCAAAGSLDLDVLEGVSSLVDENLLRQEEGAAGEPRFRMLETIREYALECLAESGEAEVTRRAHARHFLELAEQARPALWGPDQLAWFERLEAEHDNVRAALRWAQAAGDAEIGLRLAGALWQFWWVRGYWHEGRAWLEQVLAGGADLPADLRRNALTGAGAMAWAQDDFARAIEIQEATLALERELGNMPGMADALSNLAAVTTEQGDLERAEPLVEQSLLLRRALGDQRGIAVSLGILGNLAAARGDDERAQLHLRESLALHRECGNPQGAAMAIRDLGEVAQHLGDPARAGELCEEALGLFRQLDDKHGIASSLNLLADLARGEAQHGRARELHATALAAHAELGHRRGVSTSLLGLAAVALAEGDGQHAVRLLAIVDELRAKIGAPLSLAERADYERCREAAAAALAPEVFTVAWERGAVARLEQVIAEEGAAARREATS